LKERPKYLKEVLLHGIRSNDPSRTGKIFSLPAVSRYLGVKSIGNEADSLRSSLILSLYFSKFKKCNYEE